MRILVTGGAGFIGSHIVDAFVEQGHDVFVVDNLSSGRRENVNEKATFHELDIRDGKIVELFAKERFDVVCHQAAQMDVRRSVADPIFDAEVNALGTLNLLQASVQNGVKKFLFASTGGAVYGEQDYFPADEEHPLRPLSPYGITKLTGEKYLYFYRVTYGLHDVILRYANVYGPRQNPHGEAGVVAIFTTRMLAGEQAVINGDGEQTRDYVFVEDVVRANLLALDHSESDVFNVGTGKETTVNQIFKTLNELTGAALPEHHGPSKAGEQLRSVLDYNKAIRVLGWKPKVEMNEGLRRTVEFFRQP